MIKSVEMLTAYLFWHAAEMKLCTLAFMLHAV